MKPLTIEEMREIAQQKGGRCLSSVYVNNRTPLKWECSKGHQWETTPGQIKSGSWCPICAGIKPLTIEEMKKIAHSRGGKCLSSVYVNNRTPLEWECGEKHRWTATPRDIKTGTWCPVCAGNIPQSIEEMRDIAESRGGKCLSTVYKNKDTKLQWECSKGHQWDAIPHNIKDGHWCPICGGTQKLTIDEMHAIAKSRGGKCLSTEYINNRTPLEWECAEDHQWKAAASDIKQGTWCPTCAHIARSKISFQRETDYKKLTGDYRSILKSS